MTAFGIDFGTTNSVLAVSRGSEIEVIRLDESTPANWAEKGFDCVLPTILSERAGSLEYGWVAKRNPNRLAAVKRLFQTADDVTIGSRTLKVEEAAAVFFRQIKNRAIDSGFKLDRAVVTIPANSRGSARYRTKISAGLAGIEVVALLNEPTAAAMAYAKSINDGERVLVFDWGGGTLDVTVLQNIEGTFIEETSKGIQRLGGIDIDDAFMATVAAKTQVGSIIDPFDLEFAKVLLSTQEQTTLSLLGGGSVEITRADLESSIHDLVNRVNQPIEQCLRDLDGSPIHHLVMVGGSSKIPMVQRYVQDLLHLEPMAHVDPMTAIAEGAALAAGILSGDIEDHDFFVGTEHALGTVTNDRGPDHPEFSVLIPRNTKLPASARGTYFPSFDHQDSVLIRIIEGDPDLPFNHEDNVILKMWDVELDALPKSDSSFEVAFSYDVDGILHVKASYENTGKVILDEELSFGSVGSKSDLVSMRRKVDELDSLAKISAVSKVNERQHLSEESRLAIEKAEKKIYPFVASDEQVRISSLVEQLESSDSDGEVDARDALEDEIRNHSYLL